MKTDLSDLNRDRAQERKGEAGQNRKISIGC